MRRNLGEVGNGWDNDSHVQCLVGRGCGWVGGAFMGGEWIREMGVCFLVWIGQLAGHRIGVCSGDVYLDESGKWGGTSSSPLEYVKSVVVSSLIA